jgi:hypothetical protein
MKKKSLDEKKMTSCLPPYSHPCSDTNDCRFALIAENTTDSGPPICKDHFCYHPCMEQYTEGALPSYGNEHFGKWCGATNNGVPWGSVCVADLPLQEGEVPIQCALPSESYVCPEGWSKALWNNGRVSITQVCNGGTPEETRIACFGQNDRPCCTSQSEAKCGNC